MIMILFLILVKLGSSNFRKLGKAGDLWKMGELWSPTSPATLIPNFPFPKLGMEEGQEQTGGDK